MNAMEIVFEIIVVIASVIGLMWAGIFIGREFGTFEKFVLWFISHKFHLSEYDDGNPKTGERFDE